MANIRTEEEMKWKPSESMGYMNVQVNDRDSEISLAASSEWVCVWVPNGEWMSAKRKSIARTYITCQYIHIYTHFFLKKMVFNPSILRGFYSVHIRTHTHSRKHCTQTFSFSGGSSNLKKITTTEWERKSFYFVWVLCVFCSMHKSTVI